MLDQHRYVPERFGQNMLEKLQAERRDFAAGNSDGIATPGRHLVDGGNFVGIHVAEREVADDQAVELVVLDLLPCLGAVLDDRDVIARQTLTPR
ncbi:MAG: hypothetical protein JWO40_535 [Candidatus Doudnabacteria bacterium]|nr:hypothetical protein [Candidatus Doudnabacteria bacterium]